MGKSSIYSDAFEKKVNVKEKQEFNRFIIREIVTVNPDGNSQPTTDNASFRFAHQGLTNKGSSQSPPKMLNLKGQSCIEWAFPSGFEVQNTSDVWGDFATDGAFVCPYVALAILGSLRIVFNDAEIENIPTNLQAIGHVKNLLKSKTFWDAYKEAGMYQSDEVLANGCGLETWGEQLLITEKRIRVPLWLLSEAFDNTETDFFVPCRNLYIDATRAPTAEWLLARGTNKSTRIKSDSVTVTMYLEYATAGLGDTTVLMNDFKKGFKFSYYQYSVASTVSSITSGSATSETLQVPLKGCNYLYPIISKQMADDVFLATATPKWRSTLQGLSSFTCNYRGQERPYSSQMLKSPTMVVGTTGKQYHILYNLYKERMQMQNKQLTSSAILSYPEFYENPLICISMANAVNMSLPEAETDTQDANINISVADCTQSGYIYYVAEQLKQIPFDSDFNPKLSEVY